MNGLVAGSAQWGDIQPVFPIITGVVVILACARLAYRAVMRRSPWESACSDLPIHERAGEITGLMLTCCFVGGALGLVLLITALFNSLHVFAVSGAALLSVAASRDFHAWVIFHPRPAAPLSGCDFVWMICPVLLRVGKELFLIPEIPRTQHGFPVSRILIGHP